MCKFMSRNSLVSVVICFYLLTSTMSLVGCGGGGGETFNSSPPTASDQHSDIIEPTIHLTTKEQIINYLDSIGIYFENGAHPQGAEGITITEYGFASVISGNQNDFTTTLNKIWSDTSSLISINKTPRIFVMQ